MRILNAILIINLVRFSISKQFSGNAIVNYLLKINQNYNIQLGKLQINEDLQAKYSMGAQSLESDSVLVHTLDQKDILTTETLIVDQAQIDKLEVDQLIAFSQEDNIELQIDSDIEVESIGNIKSLHFQSLNNEQMTNGQRNNDDNNSQLQFSQVSDWKLVHHDNFENQESLVGWNMKIRNYCGNPQFEDLNEHQKSNFDPEQFILQEQDQQNSSDSNTDYFLGGHCLSSKLNLQKQYKNLKRHSQIKISAQIHMLDHWQGERVYLKLDGKTVWQKQSQQNNVNSGIDVCGGQQSDQAFSIPLEINVPHKSENATLVFGSTLNKHPCEASYAIDNVMIYLK